MLRSRQCTAKVAGTGEPCPRGALFGLTVCGAHGGAAPRAWTVHKLALGEARLIERYEVREPDEVLDHLAHKYDVDERRAWERYEDEPTEVNRAAWVEASKLSYAAHERQWQRRELQHAPHDDDIERILAAAEAELRRRGVEVEPREPLIIEAAPTVEGEWTQ